MNAIKKILGLLWMLLGASLVAGLPYSAFLRLSANSAKTEDYVFWLVIVVIFLPITVGLGLFGWYAWQGEYED